LGVGLKLERKKSVKQKTQLNREIRDRNGKIDTVTPVPDEPHFHGSAKDGGSSTVRRFDSQKGSVI